MIGVLACAKCAVHTNQWRCQQPDGTYVPNNRPGRKPKCFDSWDHIEREGTHVAMALLYPWSALQQGSEEYLRRYLARFAKKDDAIVNPVRDALTRWDTELRPTSPARRAT
jgi:hypothetical protein